MIKLAVLIIPTIILILVIYGLSQGQIDIYIPVLNLDKGKSFNLERYKIYIPNKAYREDLSLNLTVSPIVRASEEIHSIIYSLDFSAEDRFGNAISTLDKEFSLTADFNGYDLTPYKTDSITIYHSNIDNNWTKLDTKVDLGKYIAVAKSNRLGHFALMAKRVDTIAPTTKLITKDRTVILDSNDNDDGLGIDYVLYKIDDGDWQQYTAPFIISDTGKHIISFYSVDRDENIEEVKTSSFIIKE